MVFLTFLLPSARQLPDLIFNALVFKSPAALLRVLFWSSVTAGQFEFQGIIGLVFMDIFCEIICTSVAGIYQTMDCLCWKFIRCKPQSFPMKRRVLPNTGSLYLGKCKAFSTVGSKRLCLAPVLKLVLCSDQQ